MEEQNTDQQQEQITSALSLHTMSLAEKLKYAACVAIPGGVGLEILGASAEGLLLACICGIVAGYFSEEIRDNIIDKLPLPRQAGVSRQSKLTWLLTGQPPVHQPQAPLQGNEREEPERPPAEEHAIDAAFLKQDTAEQKEPFQRITIDDITRHVARNSYTTYIGRSLTNAKDGNPAIAITFYKRHMKIIGASQHGKSSMAAALLDAIARTHDEDHVIIALLDLEYKTSKLFERLPHIAIVDTDAGPVLLHARDEREVLDKLELILELIEYRYTLSKSEVDQQPLLIVYIEEFIDLKDHFKQQIDQAVTPAEKEQATKNYERFIHCMKKIARRGLKVLVQLLMCAQMDYADEDLKEALINVTSGMSFCVRTTAAQAAGFYRTNLLRQNAMEDAKGHAVVEMPEVKDLIQAPEYDLKKRLLAMEKTTHKAGQSSAPTVRPVRSGVETAHSDFGARTEARDIPDFELEDEQEIGAHCARTETGVRPPGETAHSAHNDAQRYQLNKQQVLLFCQLYPDPISNKDEALKRVGANSRYRDHANEIIQQYQLDNKKRG